MDLFVVSTIGFDLLYVLVIVRLARRELVWIYVTAYRPLNGSRGRLPKHLLGCPWLVIVVLALAAVIAQHSPAVRALDKRAIARLFSFGVTPSCGRIVGVGISDKPARPVSSNCTPLRRSVQRFGAIVTTPVPVRIAPSLRADMIFREGQGLQMRRLSRLAPI